MGVVYKARQRKLNRTVALKMILAGQFATEDAVKRFYTEAEAAARLDHPGIVPIYEVGHQDGQHFMALAFVDGQSLSQQVSQSPLAPRHAAWLMQQVAAAVHFAHQHGIIHRDLKPQNILLTKDGQPKVTDFGLAKKEAADSSLTATGEVMGTPSYMPPEQAAGKTAEIGPAADIYSLGATLYCLLTGRPPFQAATTLDTLLQVLEQEPISPGQLNPAVPRDLATICLKCLRKEPEKRYATALELAEDLERWLTNQPIRARPVGRGEKAWLWCKRRPTIAAAIAVTALAIVVSGITVGATRSAATKRQAATEAKAAREQAETVVASHLIAPAAAVPYTLQQIKPLQQYALPLLQAKLADESADKNERLHAAYGLAELGEPQQAFLLDAIPAAPASEYPNFMAALQGVKSTALPELAERSAKATEPMVKFRYAILALQFGDPKPAQDCLALRADPIDRTTLIHSFVGWHGDLTLVADLLSKHDDPAWRSGLCAALGTIPREGIPAAERDTVSRTLVALYTQAPDGGTHSAAGWALRQWGQVLPAITATANPPTGCGWHVNGQGQTMIAIPAGRFTMEGARDVGNRTIAPHEVAITRGFLLDDREVTVEQFRRFVEDTEYPAEEERRTANERSPGVSPFSDGPVNNVNLSDAVLYCNWLSAREGLRPAYERTGKKWKWMDQFTNLEREADAWKDVSESNGYRLPTGEEWEYACRSMAASAFCFGNDEDTITQYGWTFNNSKSHAWPGGLKMPNGWGFFDMHGNLWEWCDDPRFPDEVTAYDQRSHRVMRGGSFDNPSPHARSAMANANPNPGYRSYLAGFRPARTYP